MSERAKADSISTRSEYKRFNISQRVEHALLLLSFSTLAITGLVQKFGGNPVSRLVIKGLGGINVVQEIHHVASYVLAALAIYHLLTLLFYWIVVGVPARILPNKEDFQHFYQDLLYYLGKRPEPASYDRYSYAEKVEYLAVIWGTLIMAVTGFMLINPLISVRIFPGEAIPIAKAVHSAEALLAVLAILVWHVYHVHLKHFNKSIFTGKLSREEMIEEHPAELARIEKQETQAFWDQVDRKQLRVFIPAAALISVAAVFGMYVFIAGEKTAVKDPEYREGIVVFATAEPTPTLRPPQVPAVDELQSWEEGFEDLFRVKCTPCHGGVDPIQGLDYSSRLSALEGGESGAAIVPGDSESSLLVEIQQEGEHPGQLTAEELQRVIEWIESGAQ